MTDIHISGIQEAMARNQRRISNLQPSGAFGRLIKTVLILLHRFMTMVTHVQTGALRASERMELEDLRGRIFIDPSAINPNNHVKTSEYAVYENERGGEHAFFDRTVDYSPDAVAQGVRAFMNEF